MQYRMKYISTTLITKNRTAIASINWTSEILNELFGYFDMNNGSICYTNLNSVYCCEYKRDTMYLYTHILTLFDTFKSFIAECSFHTTCLNCKSVC